MPLEKIDLNDHNTFSTTVESTDMLPEPSCLKIALVWAWSQFFFRGPTGPPPLPPYVRHLRPATPLVGGPKI